MKHYDYIFAGAGLASLMTVYKMAISGKFTDASVLLIDPDSKKDNDRTWCFWQKGPGAWDSIIYKIWDTARFANEKRSTDLDFSGYKYKMIRGIDFYNFVFDDFRNHPNIELANKRVIEFADSGSRVKVMADS